MATAAKEALYEGIDGIIKLHLEKLQILFIKKSFILNTNYSKLGSVRIIYTTYCILISLSTMSFCRSLAAQSRYSLCPTSSPQSTPCCWSSLWGWATNQWTWPDILQVLLLPILNTSQHDIPGLPPSCQQRLYAVLIISPGWYSWEKWSWSQWNLASTIAVSSCSRGLTIST